MPPHKCRSETDGPTGRHTVFESTHVTRLLDEASLQLGDIFILCFDAVGKNGFKKFALNVWSAGQDNLPGVAKNDDADDVPY